MLFSTMTTDHAAGKEGFSQRQTYRCDEQAGGDWPALLNWAHRALVYKLTRWGKFFSDLGQVPAGALRIRSTTPFVLPSLLALNWQICLLSVSPRSTLM